MIVVDASAVVEALLRREDAVALEERIFAPGETLHPPFLMEVEVAQVVRRYVARREITTEQGETIMQNLIDFPVQLYPHRELLQRIWDLRHNLTAYDAAYVALAELLDAPLLTRDRRLAAAPGHSALVEMI